MEKIENHPPKVLKKIVDQSPITLIILSTACIGPFRPRRSASPCPSNSFGPPSRGRCMSKHPCTDNTWAHPRLKLFKK